MADQPSQQSVPHSALLRKIPTSPLNQTDLWGDDTLERKDLAAVMEAVLASTQQPFVVAIDAPYGTGKTFFLTRLHQQMCSKDYACVFVNAWATDFAGDPLTALISELTEQLGQLKLLDAPDTRKAVAKKVGGYLLRHVGPAAMRLSTAGLLDLDALKTIFDPDKKIDEEIVNLAAKVAEDRISGFLDAKKSIENFRSLIASIVEQIRESKTFRGESLYVFVDELDRCKPPYAIELLETVKHLFSVEGLVFVLGADHQQLESCVAAVYGVGIDRDGYLRRLIDWQYTLPLPAFRPFCDHLYKKYYLAEIKGVHQESLCSILAYVSHKWSFSLRTIEQCFTQINLACRSRGEGREPAAAEFAILIALRSYDRTRYNRYVNGVMSPREIACLACDEKEIASAGSRSDVYDLKFTLAMLFYMQLGGNQALDTFISEYHQINSRGRPTDWQGVSALEIEAIERAIDFKAHSRIRPLFNQNLATWADSHLKLTRRLLSIPSD